MTLPLPSTAPFASILTQTAACLVLRSVSDPAIRLSTQAIHVLRSKIIDAVIDRQFLENFNVAGGNNSHSRARTRCPLLKSRRRVARVIYESSPGAESPGVDDGRIAICRAVLEIVHCFLIGTWE